MPGTIFFRDARATVTSSDLVVGQRVVPLGEILSARGVRLRSILPLLQPNRFALIVTTTSGEWEVLRERNGYVVFQLEKAIETALRARKDEAARRGVSLPSVTLEPRAEAGSGALEATA